MTRMIEHEQPHFSKDVLQLIEMLRWRRPAWSKTEKKFIDRYIAPAGPAPDKFGNYILRIGEAPVLWSCHTDTVHMGNGIQRVVVENGDIKLPLNQKDSNCLGADCTAGVWMMLQMIEAKCEGLYVFHREEERGCKGSRFIADKTPELLKDIKFAIAFDRRGFNSIITHQTGGKCASQEFVASIKTMLPAYFIADDTGLVTDTATYTKLVSECSNLSVGFTSEHSSSEHLSISHITALRDAMLLLDPYKLVAKRDPSITEYKSYKYGYSGGSGYGFRGGWENGEYYPRPRSMADVVKQYPFLIADMLVAMGFTTEELLKEIDELYKFPDDN